MAVKNTPQRIARRSGVKVPACLLVFGFPEGMSREEGRPVSRAKKNGSKSLNEQKLASGVSGFPPEIQDGLHGFRDRQIRRIQHPGILRGSERRAARWVSRASRSRISRKRSSRLAEIPFSINCLRRLSARATTSATRNTLRDASGNTTVPMSRRRPPGPAAHGKPAGAPAAPGARRETPPRGKRSCPPLHGVSRGRRRRLPGDMRPVETHIQRLGDPGHRRLVLGGHALAHGGQGRQAVERAAVQHIPAQRLGDAVRHGALPEAVGPSMVMTGAATTGFAEVTVMNRRIRLRPKPGLRIRQSNPGTSC